MESSVTRSIDAMLECPICHDFFEEVVEIACCSQCFCRACITDWLNRKSSCPGCRSDTTAVSLTPNRPLQRLVDQIETECPNAEHGCTAMVPRCDVMRHRQSCEHEMVACEYCEALEESERMAGVCERKPRARQLQHMREECPYRIVPCPSEGCDVDGLKQHLVADHMQEECLFRMISCSEGCGAQMQRRDLPEHLQTACSAAHIACPYAQFGCGEQKMPRPEMHEHLREAALEHVQLMQANQVVRAMLHISTMGSTRELREQITALQEHIRELASCVSALSSLKPALPHAPMQALPVALPSWMRTVKSELVTVKRDSGVCALEFTMPFIRIFSRQQGGQREAEMVFGNRPIPNVEGLFFFECTIKHAGVSGAIGLGISALQMDMAEKNPAAMPVGEQCAGWIEHSCGYHGDDGKKFGPECRARGAGYGPVFGSGDVVGCGFRPKSGEIFFTKNKIYLGVAFSALPQGTYYPVVGLHSGGARVVVNFGSRPFCFDFASVPRLDAAVPDDAAATSGDGE